MSPKNLLEILLAPVPPALQAFPAGDRENIKEFSFFEPQAKLRLEQLNSANVFSTFYDAIYLKNRDNRSGYSSIITF